MNSKHLIFDYGASQGRCIVASYSGDSFKMDVVHQFDNQPVNFAGTLYWDILRLSLEMKIGVQKAFAKYGGITSMGVDTWGCDFGFIDRDGKLLANPVSYRDELRYCYKPLLDKDFGEFDLFRLSGTNTNTIMGLYHLYGLLQENSVELQSADKLMMMPDLLNYYLTGCVSNEYTNATMMLMVDQKNKTWHDAIIDRLGIPKHLFSLLSMPGTVIGDIQKKVCEDFGISPIPVICVASHDTASAIAGLPIHSDAKSWGFLSLGTWAILGIETDDQYVSKEVFKSGFANQGGCEGKTNFVNLFTGLWVIQQCFAKWRQDIGQSFSWDDLVALVDQSDGGIAFIDLDSIDFAMPNPNMPLVIQEYCKKTGQNIPQTTGEIARCVYESLVLKIKQCYENMEEATNANIEVLHIVGGGSKNGLLCRWIADALQLPVLAGPAETTSVGNLLMQLKGVGAIGSLKEGRELSYNSSAPKEYLPSDSNRWEEMSLKYRQMHTD